MFTLGVMNQLVLLIFTIISLIVTLAGFVFVLENQTVNQNGKFLNMLDGVYFSVVVCDCCVRIFFTVLRNDHLFSFFFVSERHLRLSVTEILPLSATWAKLSSWCVGLSCLSILISSSFFFVHPTLLFMFLFDTVQLMIAIGFCILPVQIGKLVQLMRERKDDRKWAHTYHFHTAADFFFSSLIPFSFFVSFFQIIACTVAPSMSSS